MFAQVIDSRCDVLWKTLQDRFQLNKGETKEINVIPARMCNCASPRVARIDPPGNL
jgi:hypothetical protein